MRKIIFIVCFLIVGSNVVADDVMKSSGTQHISISFDKTATIILEIKRNGDIFLRGKLIGHDDALAKKNDTVFYGSEKK